jgi:hypothetical protein
MTKLYLSFFTRNKILIYVLSGITMMFAILDIYNDYRATTTKGAILNIRLENANKDIINNRAKIDSLTKALTSTLKDEATLDTKYGSAKKREEARAGLRSAKEELTLQIDNANMQLKESISSFERLKDKEVFHLDKAIVKSLIIIAIEIILSFLLTNRTDNLLEKNMARLVEEVVAMCPKYKDFDIFMFPKEDSKKIINSSASMDKKMGVEDKYFIKLLMDYGIVEKNKLNYETQYGSIINYIESKLKTKTI